MPILLVICIAVGSAIAGALPVTICVKRAFKRKTNRQDSERARLLTADIDEGVEAPELYPAVEVEEEGDDESTTDTTVLVRDEVEIRPGIILAMPNRQERNPPSIQCSSISTTTEVIRSPKEDYTMFSRISSVLAEECKLCLPGLVKDNPANRMVVRKWMADRLLSADSIRRKHKSRILPLATALVFIPTSYEIDVVRIEATDEVVTRKEDLDAKYWSYAWPSAAHPLGRVVSHQRSTDH